MVAAFEILVANNPVRNLIREGKTNQLLNVITTNQQEGMCTLEASLVDLIQSEVVSTMTPWPSPLTPRSSSAC